MQRLALAAGGDKEIAKSKGHDVAELGDLAGQRVPPSQPLTAEVGDLQGEDLLAGRGLGARGLEAGEIGDGDERQERLRPAHARGIEAVAADQDRLMHHLGLAIGRRQPAIDDPEHAEGPVAIAAGLARDRGFAAPAVGLDQVLPLGDLAFDRDRLHRPPGRIEHRADRRDRQLEARHAHAHDDRGVDRQGLEATGKRRAARKPRGVIAHDPRRRTSVSLPVTAAAAAAWHGTRGFGDQAWAASKQLS